MVPNKTPENFPENSESQGDAAKQRIGGIQEEFAGMYSDLDLAEAAKPAGKLSVEAGQGHPMYDEEFSGPVSAPRGTSPEGRYNDEDGVFALPPETKAKPASPANADDDYFDDGSMYGGVR